MALKKILLTTWKKMSFALVVWILKKAIFFLMPIISWRDDPSRSVCSCFNSFKFFLFSSFSQRSFAISFYGCNFHKDFFSKMLSSLKMALCTNFASLYGLRF